MGDLGWIPGLGRSHGGGHDNPLQYSSLENPMDRGEPGGLQSMGSQRLTTQASPAVYWVGQTVCLGFSVTSNRNTQTNFLADPIAGVLSKDSMQGRLPGCAIRALTQTCSEGSTLSLTICHHYLETFSTF